MYDQDKVQCLRRGSVAFTYSHIYQVIFLYDRQFNRFCMLVTNQSLGKCTLT